MALQSSPGPYLFLGPSQTLMPQNSTGTINVNAVNGAAIVVGRMMTSDGGSHTIDTTGSSSIGWMTGSGVTFASGSTTVKVGIAAVDTSNGQPGRAVNSSGTITFDVAASFTGGGGGITDNAWQTSVPTTGTKTIAHGDLVAVAVQMTARGGSDLIPLFFAQPSYGQTRPSIASFNGSTYTQQSQLVPNFFVTFADGATGWIQGGDIMTNLQQRTWNSGSGTKEYGQLFQMPFPMKICGVYGWGNFSNDLTVNLYSDPLGTPTVQKAATIVAKTLATATGFWFEEFSSPYTTTANQPVGAVLTPGASNVNAFYKTLQSATHRASDPWGTSGYGISRASGAFATTNSNKDHYYIGLLVSAFDDATGGGGGGGSSVGIIGS